MPQMETSEGSQRKARVCVYGPVSPQLLKQVPMFGSFSLNLKIEKPFWVTIPPSDDELSPRKANALSAYR